MQVPVERVMGAGLDRQVVWLSVMTLVLMIGGGAIVPVLPLHARDLGASYAAAGALISAFAAGRLAVSYAAGALSETVSPRISAALGAAIVGFAAVSYGWAPSYRWLLAIRVLEGVGSGLYVMTVMAIFARTIDAPRMGKAMSFYQGLLLFGASLGPAVGGVVAERFGLRATFLVLVATSIAVAILSLWIPEGTAPPTNARRDSRRTMTEIGRLTREPAFRFLLLLSFFIFAARSGLRMNLIPLFAAERIGLGESAIGLVLSGAAFSNFAVLWHAGPLIDRRGRRRVALPTLLATAVTCLAFLLTSGFTTLFVAGAALGAALGYLAPAPAAMVADLTPRALMGPAMGLYRSAADVGLLLGPVALGALATAWSFEAAFGAAAFASVATFAIGLAVPETLRSRRSRSVVDPTNERT